MAALPVNNTARLVVTYQWGGKPYTVQYRHVNSIVASVFSAALDIIHGLWAPYFDNTWAVTGAVYYEIRAINSFPYELGSAGTVGSAGNRLPNIPDSLQYEATGRSLDGRQVSWYHRGLRVAVQPSLRLPKSYDGYTDEYLDGFGTLVGAGLCTVSGQPPLLKHYINQVSNDYLTRLARG